jgi:hypothetical protein
LSARKFSKEDGVKNWKTTAGGILGGVSLVAAGLKQALSGDFVGGATAVISGLALAFAGWHAQDKG